MLKEREGSIVSVQVANPEDQVLTTRRDRLR